MFKFSASDDFLREFRDGERSALEQVYVAYIDEVEAIVCRFLAAGTRGRSLRDSTEAGDLVQEVFIRAFSDKARRSFDSRRDFGPFLGALTRNLLFDWARRRGREILSDDLDGYCAPSSRNRVEPWAARDTIATVSEYIARLPADLRAVHEYRYVQCLTQEKACELLGISRQALRTREGHLRDGLRRCLKRRELAGEAHPLSSLRVSSRP